MIAYFPAPYPDELLYSQLARYYTKSGYTAYAFAAEDLYQQQTVRPDMEFINALTLDALQAITRDRTMDEIILKNTMFPYYGRFLPKERRLKAFQALISMKGNYYQLLQIPNKKGIIDKNLKYCSLCSSKDRQDYGETYWHRAHQINGLNICPIHKCYLHNTNIPIKGKVFPLLKAAENEIPLLEVSTQSSNKVEYYVAEYMFEVFKAKVDFKSNITVNEFFISCLANSEYCSLDGQQKYIGQLYNDFMKFYKSLGNNHLPELWQFYKIFVNDRVYFDEICLLAIFLGIPALKLTSTNVSGNIQQKTDIAIIKQNRETKPQYWARVIVWAANQIKDSGSPLIWKKIYELTNLRFAYFKACLPYLDNYADETLAKQLRELV